MSGVGARLFRMAVVALALALTERDTSAQPVSSDRPGSSDQPGSSDHAGSDIPLGSSAHPASPEQALSAAMQGSSPAQSKGPDAGAVAPAATASTVMVVIGIPGEETYATAFSEEADRWKKLSLEAGASCLVIGRVQSHATAPESSAEVTESGPTDLKRFEDALAAEPKSGPGRLWIVLVGHGSFDGREAWFNLNGPDLSATELAKWLKPFKRPVAVIDTSSSSAPFISKLSGPGRVVITSTRSGEERNYARFGTYLAAAIDDPASDLDRDGQVSLLEAFLSASARVADFYKTAGRLATEHPLIDDNGDGLGTPADWFQGVRAIKRARDGAAADGPLASQFVLLPSEAERNLPPEVRAKRDELELEVARLRDQKPRLPEDVYYSKLEQLMLQIAHLYGPSAESAK